MTVGAGEPDFDQSIEEDPVLYVVDDGPDGPDELLRLAPAEPEADEDADDEAETSAHDDETTGSSRALPR